MPEQSKHDLVDRLLERDVPLDDERYARHRRQLDDQLRKAVRDERVVRMATLLTWAGALSFLPLTLALQRLTPRGGLPAGLLGDAMIPGAIVLSLACGALAIPMLVLYLARYRRILDRARDAARDTALVELQQAVEQLKGRLEARDKAP